MNLLNEYKEFNWIIESDIDQEIDNLRRYKEIQKEMSGKTKRKGDDEENDEEADEEGDDAKVKKRESVGSVNSAGEPKPRKMSVISKQSVEEREAEMKESMAKAKATKRRKSQGDIAAELRKTKKKEYVLAKLDMPPSEYLDS